MILSMTLFWHFCLIQLQDKTCSYKVPSFFLSACLESRELRHLSFFLSSERSSVVVEMTDVVIEWDTLYLFFKNSCLWLATCFMCQCPSALSITMLSFAGWLSKDMYIAIIVKISQAPTQLALLLLLVSREQFKVCANRFEWHPATVLFVYSVLLSLPGQPPCLHLGFCRDSVAVSAADLLLRAFQCADACGKRGYSDFFKYNFAHTTFPTGRPCLTMISDFQPPTFEQIKTTSFRLLLWLTGQCWSSWRWW